MTDLDRSQAFYRDVIGLDVMKRFDHAIFLRVADGYAGHTAILALFDRKVPLEQTRTTLDHIAFTISREDYEVRRSGSGPCGYAPVRINGRVTTHAPPPAERPILVAAAWERR